MAARPEPGRRLAPLVLALAAGLAGCAGTKRGTPDDEPTLKLLAARRIVVAPDAGIRADEAQTIAAWRQFLESSPAAPQRAQAMRRLGDLEMDLADRRLAEGLPGAQTASGAPDYRAAIARYQELLKAYPQDPANDGVLYQLARAQEQGGDLAAALKTLDRLVAEHPRTAVRDEAQFRRGELLFAMRDHAKAEAAYASVLAGVGDTFRERALYMKGWSQFKQGRLEESLQDFLTVLDRQLAPHGRSSAELADIPGLSRADRELVEDSLRVVGIALAQLQGPASIPPLVDREVRRGYEFRLYRQLGELYVKQERVKDAADAFSAFVRRQPLHAQAPVLQARVIELYQANGFATLALEAKKDYVTRYGVDGDFRRANPEGWAQARPLVRTHLAELAQHHHALAQKSRSSADFQEAVRWYRAAIASFPDEPETARSQFLLAELLYEDRRYAEAAVEYDRAAYAVPAHAKAADAGYAVLLALAAQLPAADAARRIVLQRDGIAAALKFAERFPADERGAAVLTNAAEQLFALRDDAGAARIARQVLDRQPAATAAQRRVAWTVLAHGAFEAGRYAEAERGYREVLALAAERDPGRADWTERLAAAVYKQGEQARDAGDAQAAIGHFERVAAVAPASGVRATAQFDAATARLALKDWAGAAQALEDFRTRQPTHALVDDATAKLALAYLELGRWPQAAAEFERIAATQPDAALARDALWQAAELREKAGARPAAAQAWERYLARFPQPFAPALEARWRLAALVRADGPAPRLMALMKDIRQADLAAGTQRSERSRFLGASATLALAEPVVQAYRQVSLVEPLARSLKTKKARFEEALKAYAAAADYGVAEVSTASTFAIGALYQDFGRALLASERPRKLSKAEREQYDVMLEEQAFPFEEKAAELHELNARRAAEGVYDTSVRASFDALATLRPARWGKRERGAGLEDALRGGAAATLARQAEAGGDAAAWNRAGVAWRQAGDFAQARAAYERALVLDEQHADARLNLGILLDLYLGDREAALAQYERVQAQAQARGAAPDAQLAKWIAEARNRKPAAQVAKKEGPAS